MTAKKGADIVYLTQYDERTAPASLPLLGVSVVEDEVFLSIAKYEETHKTGTYTDLEQVSVRLDDLLLAIEAGIGGHLGLPIAVVLTEQSLDTKTAKRVGKHLADLRKHAAQGT